MAVEEVSAAELAGLDFEIDEDGEMPLGLIEEQVEAAAEGEVAEDLGFEEDVPAQAVADAYEVGGEAGEEVDELAWYKAAAANGEEEEGEEEEEEEEQLEKDEVVVPEAAATEDAGEEEDDDIMFFEDTAAVASPDASAPELVKAPVALEEPVEATEAEGDETMQLGPCANCGLPGHATTNCPFGHPEDIQLGDMEESDSDNDLLETHPLLSRYVSQHAGALVPKIKKGLTGKGRFFGDDKAYKQCWVCGAEDHESNGCKLKLCFFCGGPGHDSRECSEKNKICSHCRCKGHLPIACPTLASQELVSFASTHCLRCGEIGHASCGPPPCSVSRPPTPQMPSPMMQMQNQQFVMQRPPPPPPQGLFNMGLPPPTPCSPPPSPGPGSPGAFQVVRPPRLPLRLPSPVGGVESTSMFSGAMHKATSIFSGSEAKASSVPQSKTSASMSFLNGGPQVISPPSFQANTVVAGADAAPLSKSGKAAISKVPGKAPISKVPGKAPITKMPGQVPGKAPISKVPGKAPIAKIAPMPKVPGKDLMPQKNNAPIMKASGKRPSKGGMPSPKKAKHGKGW